MLGFAKSVLAASALALSLQGCTTMRQDEPATANAPAGSAAAVAINPVQATGPALWRVSDEDTTIYLFGTVHALPGNVTWYRGPVETALAGSDILITELPASAMADPASQETIAALAMLPQGQSLRDMLNEEERAAYGAALGALSLPPAAFDRFEPWFAAMTLSILPLIQNGWTPEMGVESVINKRFGPDKPRDALETLEQQMTLFDGLSPEAQVDYLMAVTRQIDQIVPVMDRMVAEWAEGDAGELATLMNGSMDDPRVAELLLYNRNANWAQWIADRMDQPGTVFIAVGAGHLAGPKSVQDYLQQRDITVERVQ